MATAARRSHELNAAFGRWWPLAGWVLLVYRWPTARSEAVGCPRCYSERPSMGLPGISLLDTAYENGRSST
jgi:hypothetical protein